MVTRETRKMTTALEDQIQKRGILLVVILTTGDESIGDILQDPTQAPRNIMLSLGHPALLILPRVGDPALLILPRVDDPALCMGQRAEGQVQEEKCEPPAL